MTTSAASLTYDNSTDALFRAWALGWDTALLAVGLTAYAQTGEIDFATVTKPTAANQSRGFRVYRWNDGSTEIYMRVGYGSVVGGATHPGVHIYFGRTLDGSGNFTGTDVTGAFNFPLTNGAATVIAVTTNFCKSGACLAIANNEASAGTSAYPNLLTVDRSRDASGAVTNSGAIILTNGFNTNSQYNFSQSQRTMGFLPVSSAPQVYANFNDFVSFRPPASTSWSNGTDVGVGIMGAWWGRPWQTIACCCVSPTDFATSATFAVSFFGVSHTYRQVGLAVEGNAWTRQAYIWE
jgi:hypothetical protein